jgi:hypothetical protein
MSYSSLIPYIIETLQGIKRLLLSGQQELRPDDNKKREREEELEVSSNKKMKKNDC